MIYWLEQNLLTCFFKSNFGIECLGCGMQRALIALLKGDVLDSVKHNVGLLPFIITIIALVIQLKFKHQKGGMYILILFSITCSLTLIHYIYKQVLFFNN